MTSKTTNKFSPEVRTRAVRLVLDHDWTIDPDQKPVDRVLVLRDDPAAHEDHHQGRHQRDRQNRRSRHGEGLGEGERPEHPAFLRFECEDRQE